VCRQKDGLFVRVGYMELCVSIEKDYELNLVICICVWTERLNVCSSWLHGAVCRQRAELWRIFCSSLLTVSETTERYVLSSLK
jgi:predicted membrane protein